MTPHIILFVDVSGELKPRKDIINKTPETRYKIDVRLADICKAPICLFYDTWPACAG